MNRMQAIARIALATLALYIVLQTIKSIVSSVYFLGHAGELPITVRVISLFSIVGLTVFASIIAHQLLIKGDKWALRIVSSPQENLPHTNLHWLPTTYRLLSILVGILFLYWTVPACFAFLTSFSLRIVPSYGRYSAMSPDEYFWPRLASFAIRIALTIYFLCGAPQFVRWHLRKVLAQSEKSTADN